MISAEERNWATLAHLAGLAIFMFIPGINIVGPLIVWMLKKEQMPFVADQAREALNFQISISIYLLISIVLIFVVVGIFTFIAVGVFDIVMIIMAALSTSKGEPYRYPLTLRLVS